MIEITTSEILERRPRKTVLDPMIPYHYLKEFELQDDGLIHPVNTIFLTNRECPFKCLMCDLWKNTLDEPTPKGAIPAQIRYALDRLPEAKIIKLYNSGNFFDSKAIPESDYEEIADLLSDYHHIIVENHPKLTNSSIEHFQSLINGSLEIAMGLETIHPVAMAALNKQITTDLFRSSADYLLAREIQLRAFVLLNPPFIHGIDENIHWTLKSIEFAFKCGVSVCSIIPVRKGNGIMDELERDGNYEAPSLYALEEVFEKALNMEKGRVFCDTWDLKQFSDCDYCFSDRVRRLSEMNSSQKVLPFPECDYCNPWIDL
ncbi:MAG: radical SAM protein [Balneolaceae bacterium]|nr:MAG: radical SAM protein [Balneolaceae bacterium]